MEFWLYFIPILFIIAVIFNCFFAVGMNRKVVLIGNGVMIAVLAGVFVFSWADGEMMRRETNGLSDTVLVYEREENGFHIFRETYFIFFGTPQYIAVPSANCELPVGVTEGSRVIVFYEGDELLTDAEPVYGQAREYRYAEGVRKIYRSNFGDEFIILLFDILLMLAFNFIELLVVIGQLCEEAAKKRNEKSTE